jgi:hypothetical protein
LILRGERRAIVPLLAAALACTPAATPSAPPPAPDAPAPDAPAPDAPTREPASAACEAHVDRLREELCGPPEDRDESCEIELACAHALDFDGDGEPETVELADESGALALRVRFADGHEELVGATPTRLTEIGEPEGPGDEPRTLEADWSWLVAWSPLSREGEELVDGRRRFAAGGARGDGLLISGSDAAAMLVLTDAGWLVVELGY